MLTALYERLSHDDDNYGDSVSIQNQKEMLEQYAEEHGYEPYRHFTDDGWSGSNFHRPGFRAMMDLVEKGEVERIIVKDLSRFGRDYLRTGFYVEVLFPELGIHFVAIHSHVDSESGQPQDYMPFLNIINDIQNRERSRKGRAAHAFRREKRDPIKHLPPYGYLQHPEENRYVRDPEAAPIVQEIFQRRDNGESCQSIADDLNRRNVPTRALKHWMDKQERRIPPQWNRQFQWTDNTVRSVLRVEEYTGVRILGKYENVDIHVQKKSSNPVRIEGAHESLVSKDVFERINYEISHFDDHGKAVRAADLPSGMDESIYCMVCGNKMETRVSGEKILFRCPKCQRSKRAPSLYKEDLYKILHRVLSLCWDATPLVIPENPPLPPDRTLSAAYERSKSPEEFLHRIHYAQRVQNAEDLLIREEIMEQQRNLLLSPVLELWTLSTFSKQCFWKKILCDRVLPWKGKMTFQEFTLVTLFDPKDALPYSEAEQGYVLYHSRPSKEYRIRIIPDENASPSLSHRLAFCLQHNLFTPDCLKEHPHEKNNCPL